MNLVLADKETNTIRYFVKNARKKGDRLVGSNITLSGLKKSVWKIKWTEDEIEPILNNKGNIVGWDAKFKNIVESDYDPGSAQSRFKDMTRKDIIDEIDSAKNIEDLKESIIEMFKYLKHLIP